MKFGPVAPADAIGAYLAHATDAGRERFRKGRRLSAADVAALAAAGVNSVIVASLEEGDVGEDEAASRLADALAVAGADRRDAATGRVNFHAREAGVFNVDKNLVDRLNGLDPGLTLATLADLTRIEAGQMIATVKIIPFAIPGSALERAEAAAKGGQAFAVAPFRSRRVGLIQTRLPGVKETVLDKTARVTAERLKRSGSVIVDEIRCPHVEQDVAEAMRALSPLADLLVVFGASAMTDSADVVPAAIAAAGGTVERVGMPVDPGNLLVLGDLGGAPVIGAPGCARSPKENGFDWVLDRMLAGIAVDSGAIAAMGVGGLLMEIPTRPSPRETVRNESRGKIVAVILAAGASTRMGGPNKLLATFNGEPLVRRTAGRVLKAGFDRVIVVVGHQSDRVEAALSGLATEVVRNPDFLDGIAGSLKAGVAAAGDADAAMVVLADMPAVDAADLGNMIASWRSRPDAVVRATHGDRRGNPVILPRTLWGEIVTLQGDAGARGVIENSGLEVIDVDIGPQAMLDVDTPDAMASAGGQIENEYN